MDGIKLESLKSIPLFMRHETWHFDFCAKLCTLKKEHKKGSKNTKVNMVIYKGLKYSIPLYIT